MAKKRHIHRRFLVPNARRGSSPDQDEQGYGYSDQPQRPLSDATGINEAGRDMAADSLEVVAKIAGATQLCDEPENLTADEWKAHVDQRAKEHAEQQRRFEDAKREQERRMLSFEERLANVTRDAKAARHRVDISRDVRLLRHMQQTGKDVRHLERRLFLIERKVWSKPDAEAA